MFDYDLVVVGGGCSGLWAARVAQEGGLRTLLVERTTRFGERIICAEGVGRPGLQDLLKIDPAWVATEIEGALVFPPQGEAVEFSEPGCGLVLDKGAFIRGLAEACARCGVEFMIRHEVKSVRKLEPAGFEVFVSSSTKEYKLTTRSLIAADGVESSVAEMLGISSTLKPSQIFICAQYTVSPIDVDPGKVEFHLSDEFAPGGYAWVFPKGDGIANVGVGVLGNRSQNKVVEHLKHFYQTRCSGSKILGFVVGGVPALVKPLAGTDSGFFIVGDAARVADPISGAGIVPGMESAKAAALLACKYLKGEVTGKEAKSQYERILESICGHRELKFTLRGIMAKLDSQGLTRLVQIIGDYARSGGSLRESPSQLVKFLIKSMPHAFGLLKSFIRV